MNRLQDKVAIVTGGGSGIGLATADLFAREGARVMVLDIQDSRTGIEALPDLSSLHVDVTSPAQVEAAIRQVVHMHGRIDLLVNIAGGSGRKWGDGPADACTLEGWEKTRALNLDSLFYCCKYALRPKGQTLSEGKAAFSSLMALRRGYGPND